MEKKKKVRFAAGANAQLECPTENSGHFLAICDKTIMGKTMSLRDAKKEDMAFQPWKMGLFLSKE